jgi:hypothetical protein
MSVDGFQIAYEVRASQYGRGVFTLEVMVVMVVIVRSWSVASVEAGLSLTIPCFPRVTALARLVLCIKIV